MHSQTRTHSLICSASAAIAEKMKKQWRFHRCLCATVLHSDWNARNCEHTHAATKQKRKDHLANKLFNERVSLFHFAHSSSP